MNHTFRHILVLSPHPDDGELGCAGSVNKFMEYGARVMWAVFSSVNPDIEPAEVLFQQSLKARESLKIREWTDLNLPMRLLHENRQRILDGLFEIKKNFQPDLVFCPSPNDVHSDHKTIANEATRAFKNTTTLAYECAWNNPVFHTQAFIDISTSNLMAKLNSLRCYKCMSKKNYFQKDYTIGLAVTRGVQAGVNYAEAFEVLRYIIK